MKNAQKNEVEGFDLRCKLNSSSSLVFTNFPSSESVWGAQMLWFLAWVHLCSVVQSCPTLCNPMDCSHPPPRPHQTPLSMRFPRQEYWSGLTFPSPRGASQPKDQTFISWVFCIGRRIPHHWATREACGSWHSAPTSMFSILLRAYGCLSLIGLVC